MASCVKNIFTKNYQNLMVYKLQSKMSGMLIWDTVYMLDGSRGYMPASRFHQWWWWWWWWWRQLLRLDSTYILLCESEYFIFDIFWYLFLQKWDNFKRYCTHSLHSNLCQARFACRICAQKSTDFYSIISNFNKVVLLFAINNRIFHLTANLP